jgi:hypothetical protein
MSIKHPATSSYIYKETRSNNHKLSHKKWKRRNHGRGWPQFGQYKWPNNTKHTTSCLNIRDWSASQMYIRYLLLIRVICCKFFGSMCCKRCTGPSQFGVCTTQHTSSSALPCRSWLQGHQNVENVHVYLLEEGVSVNIISRRIGKERRRRGHSYRPNSLKRNRPNLHLLPTDQVKLQQAVFTLERRLTLTLTSPRKHD